MNTASFDLINADYVVGLPVTFRRGSVSSRVRLYHQSSHLGDEFLLRGTVTRENFAFEDLGPLRAYGGGEYTFNGSIRSVESRVLHGGLELRQSLGQLGGATLERARLIAGVDVKSIEELEWAVAWSARAGFEIGRATGTEHRARRWSLLAEYYDGPSPYGQFFRDEVSYYGLGLHLGL